MRSRAISYSMIISNRLTRLGSWFLRCYTSRVSSHTWASYMTLTVVYYSSLAVNIVLCWLSASTLVPSNLSRLRDTRVVDVMDVLFQSISNLSLVLFPLSTMLSMTILCWILLLRLISWIISTLPSPWISLVTIKVLFWSLSTHFLLWMFRLIYWTWSF